MTVRSDAELAHPTHPWLKPVRVAFAPGPGAPLLPPVLDGLARAFADLGNTVQTAPDDSTDVLITTALFGEPIPWREAMLFSARRRFSLRHMPALFTVVAVTPEELDAALRHFGEALRREPLDPVDFRFEGMAPEAASVLIEQGGRGGPILSLERVIQAQAKSIRVLLVVGEERPLTVYHLDLVGAHPRTLADDPAACYRDCALRVMTTVGAQDVNRHQDAGEPIAPEAWRRLATPGAMCSAGRELGRRHFFTPMVRIADLVAVPSVSDVVAAQYSEGCFSTWDPELQALITTVTGSARPVDKGQVTEDELAVVVGVREDGLGAMVRRVEGKPNSPPSSEALEMRLLDLGLPTVLVTTPSGERRSVPVARSKLHGHRGVAAFDPAWVEYTPMDAPFFHYLVSCGTDGQAQGIVAAFSRSRALRDPADRRQIVFTVLPGHGAVIVEKWVEGMAPLQVLWEAMDAGRLVIENSIPQGPMEYAPGANGRMELRERSLVPALGG